MPKGPDRIDRRGGDELIATFAQLLGPGAVQVINKPDGNRALAVSLGGNMGPDPMLDRARLLSWMEADAKPDAGTPEERAKRREDLFTKLRNITPEAAMQLDKEYFTVFPPHPGGEDMADVNGTGASVLSNHENYFFDPDRLVEMCRALQDAVRKVASEIEGPVIVLEAGYGLGYVALSALALNDELGGRVRVIGLELNKATIHRAAQILAYYGIQPGLVELVPMDATRVRGLPDNIHILVAEHFSGGVFSQEPLYAVHRNLIPQLKAPFYIIPEGLDIYGRVVNRDGYKDITDLGHAIGGRLLKIGDLSDRILNPEDVRKLLKGVNEEIIQAALLARIKFADVLDGKWNGNLDLRLRATAVKNGKGYVQLRGVPTFHTDMDRAEPVFQQDRYYVDGGQLYFGTSINHWGHVRDEKKIGAYLRSPEGAMENATNPIESNFRMLDSAEFSPVFRFEKGRMYEVSVRGSMNRFWADAALQEVKGKKK